MPLIRSTRLNRRAAITAMCSALALASPVSSGEVDPISVIQDIAGRAKLIDVAVDGAATANQWHYLITRNLLADYGGYSRFENDPSMNENAMMRNHLGDANRYIVGLNRDFSRLVSATEDDISHFEALIAGLEEMVAAGIDVHQLIDAGQTDEANLTYWNRVDPAYQEVRRATYTIRSNHGRAIMMEALNAR